MAEPIPFEQILKPLVLGAATELRSEVARKVYDQLTPAAHEGWQRHLLIRLSWLTARGLHWKFEVSKTVRAVFSAPEPTQRIVQDQVYSHFVRKHSGKQLGSLFAEFPLLIRWCTTLIENWRSAVAEFLARLAADRPALGHHLGSGRFAGCVVAIRAGLSDTHNGGRSVVRVTFQDAATLIYKPRSVASEALFADAIDALNLKGSIYSLQAARCWEREDYGWMEDIIAAPCPALEDVHGFYWRMGALLGLVYFAHGVDFHRENLVAAGPCPVLVDLETLWHPQNHVELAAPTATSHSILRTGFLSHCNRQTGRSYPWGILDRASSQNAETPGWIDVNQDGMA